MLFPSRTKYRKQHRGRNKGVATTGNTVAFGDYGLKATEGGFLTPRQIESARKAIVRYFKRGCKIWIRVYPDRPFTKKAAEVPMGSGKGSVETYRAAIQPGRVLFEIGGAAPADARAALRLASAKLPVTVKFVSNEQ